MWSRLPPLAICMAMGLLTAACSERPPVQTAATPAALAGAGRQPMQQVLAASIPATSSAAPLGSPALPTPAVTYARPDLSPDPDERARAERVNQALRRHDLAAAQEAANTRAFQELVDEGRRDITAHQGEDRAATQADQARAGAEQ